MINIILHILVIFVVFIFGCERGYEHGYDECKRMPKSKPLGSKYGYECAIEELLNDARGKLSRQSYLLLLESISIMSVNKREEKK